MNVKCMLGAVNFSTDTNIIIYKCTIIQVHQTCEHEFKALCHRSHFYLAAVRTSCPVVEEEACQKTSQLLALMKSGM